MQLTEWRILCEWILRLQNKIGNCVLILIKVVKIENPLKHSPDSMTSLYTISMISHLCWFLSFYYCTYALQYTVHEVVHAHIRPPFLCGSFSYLLSITTVFGHHLSQRLQNFDTQPLFIFLQQLLRMFDQSVHISLSLIYNIHTYMLHEYTKYFQGLLAYKTSAFALLARVCVFREEQLRPMQNIHQNWQFSLDQWAQTVLKRWHDVLWFRQRAFLTAWMI